MKRIYRFYLLPIFVVALIVSLNLRTIAANSPRVEKENILPGGAELIAVPPRIRKPELTLPEDFRVVRQMPLSSGKREIMLVSPNTGIEKVYLMSLPGAEKFEFSQVEFRKVSGIDWRPFTEQNHMQIDDAKLQSLLNTFKIIFTNDSVSKVILGDGTIAELSANQVVVKSPNGKEIERIQLPQANLPINSSIFSQSNLPTKSLGKLKSAPASNDNSIWLSQSTSACQNNTEVSLKGAENTMGALEERLGATDPVSQKSVSVVVGAALSFAVSAIKSDITAGSLQETICRPPVQCDQQTISGGSEVRTDLFQMAAGSRKEVTLEYEFFSVPDSLEMFYDGKQIFRAGPASGHGSQKFTIPDTAEQVGVTVTGNPSQPTEWWYKVSCPLGVDSPKPHIALSVPRDPMKGNAKGSGYGPHKGGKDYDFGSKQEGGNESLEALTNHSGVKKDIDDLLSELNITKDDLKKYIEYKYQPNLETDETIKKMIEKIEQSFFTCLETGTSPGGSISKLFNALFMNWDGTKIDPSTENLINITQESETLTGMKTRTLRHSNGSVLSNLVNNKGIIFGVFHEAQTAIQEQINNGTPIEKISINSTDDFPAPDFSWPHNDDRLQYTIGGIQGRAVFIDNFKVEKNNYTATLRFVLYDDYGVDSTDIKNQKFNLSKPETWPRPPARLISSDLQKGYKGMIAQWFLQHQGSAKPFVNEIIVEKEIHGTLKIKK